MQQLFPKYSQNLLLKISGKSVYLCESYSRIVDNASNLMMAISFHDTLWLMGVMEVLIKIWLFSQPTMVESKLECYFDVNLSYSYPLLANSTMELELSHLKLQLSWPQRFTFY